MNIGRTNKLLSPIHLTNYEPRAYKRFNKITLLNFATSLMKK
jgi:hypothetical protein